MFNRLLNKGKHKSSAEIVLKKKIECLILIGDSILDNFYGLSEDTKNRDIEYQILSTLHQCKANKNKSHKAAKEDSKDESKASQTEFANIDRSILRMYNLSLSAIDSAGILLGSKPADLYIKSRKAHNLRCYPLDPKDSKLYPLRIVSQMVMSHEIKINKSKSANKNGHINPTVVLSVGYSDLFNAFAKYGRQELIIESLREDKFGDKYEKIVHQMCHNLGLNLIIIIPYEFHQSFCEKQLHFSRDDLLSCMEFIGTKIMQIAEKYRVPIVDLSRTLNPFDRAHYGLTSIEPSMESGQLIVDLIIKILSVWDWNPSNTQKSKIFYGTKPFTDTHCVDNDLSYRKGYFNALQSRAYKLDKTIENADEMALLDDLFTEK